MSKEYEYRVQTSETFLTIAACVQMIRRTAPKLTSHTPSDGGPFSGTAKHKEERVT